MRTHFPGALHEVRSAARFPLSLEVCDTVTADRSASAPIANRSLMGS